MSIVRTLMWKNVCMCLIGLSVGVALYYVLVGKNHESLRVSREMRKTITSVDSKQLTYAQKIGAAWRKCMKDGAWNSSQSALNRHYLVSQVKECSQITEMANMRTAEFRNKDEKKFHVLPVQNSYSNVIVSIGIGHDIEAELQFQKNLANTKFYGADPIHDINEALYTKIGQFFPFAVGAGEGFEKASILTNSETYETRTVVQVDAVYFLKKLVKERVIDNLLLDAEGAEYDLLEYFYNDGQFDQAGIIFCQINMEIHVSPRQNETTWDFFEQILADERYIVPVLKDVSHFRLHLVNMKDDICIGKYLA